MECVADERVVRFNDAWNEQRRPDIALFVPTTTDPFREQVLVRLIEVDQRHRWLRAEPRWLESYLEDWPELNADREVLARLVREECLIRATYATAASYDELHTRFSELAKRIALEQVEQQASAARRRESLAGSERFFIVRKIGEGATGSVFETLDRQHQSRVALKVLRWAQPLALYRFKNEFRSLARLVHPNLVALHELVSSGDQWFIAMELVEGVDFLTYLRPGAHGLPTQPLEDITSGRRSAGGASNPHSSSSVDFDKLRAALRQLAEGVAALHDAEKLHRDIKPSNVLVTEQGRVVLLDFGLVAELGSNPAMLPAEATGDSVSGAWSHATTDRNIVGTIRYMSPEQAAGKRLSPASDWYAVGVMLYEALAGRPPHTGNRFQMLLDKQNAEPAAPKQLVADVPEDLNQLCLELLRPDPRARPAGAEVLARLSHRAAVSQDSTAWPKAALPFVGRQRHLATLAESFDSMLPGRAVTVHVHGRSGAGKSALVQHFLDGLGQRREVVILAGRCYEEESVPYKALDSLVDALSRYLVRLSREQAESLMPRDVAALARVFPVLRRVEAVAEAPRRVLQVAEPQELRRRAFGALRELLGRLGDRKPLVLYIDDLQWGDVDSASVLTELLRPPDEPRLLLLVCYRSEDADTNPFLKSFKSADQTRGRLRQRRELEVGPLEPGEAYRLAQTLFDAQTPASQARAEQISRESGGSPYFVYELVRHLQGGQDGVREATGLPQLGLDEVLWTRVCQLPEAPRRLLEIISVAGQPLKLQDAYEAARLAVHEQQAVTILRSDHLVRSSGPSLRDDVETYHDRIRQSVVAHLDTDTLRTHHKYLALTLQASGEADAETLAAHFRAAEQFDPAGHYYALAADQAADSLAFDRAAKLYQLSLKLQPVQGGQARLLSKLGDALANAGRGREAAEQYELAAQGAEPADSLELQRRAAFQYCISGHIDQGRAAFQKVLAAHGMKLPRSPRDAAAQLLFHWLLLRCRGLGFRARDAATLDSAVLRRLDVMQSVAMGLAIIDPVCGALFQTRNLRLALRAGEPLRISLALAWEAGYASVTGGRGRRRTVRLLDAARAVAEQLDHPHALGSSHLAVGISEMLAGRYQTACQANERAESLLRDCTGANWEIDTAQIFHAWSLFYMGQVALLHKRFEQVFQQAEERGDRYLMTTLGTQVATLLLLAADQPGQARDQLHEIMTRWTQQGFSIQHHNAFLAQQQCDLYCGDAEAAARRTAERLGEYRSSLLLGIQHIRIDLLQMRGRTALMLAARSTNRQPLLRSTARYVRRLRREKMPWSDALARLLEAGTASLKGERSRTTELLTQAVDELQSADLVLSAAAARRRLGELSAGEEGQTLVAQANAWMTDQGIVDPTRMTALYAPGFA